MYEIVEFFLYKNLFFVILFGHHHLQNVSNHNFIQFFSENTKRNKKEQKTLSLFGKSCPRENFLSMVSYFSVPCDLRRNIEAKFFYV